jgi:hypothetical protein
MPVYAVSVHEARESESSVVVTESPNPPLSITAIL